MPIKLSGNDFGEYYYSHDCGTPYERTEPWLTFFDNIADRIVKSLNRNRYWMPVVLMDSLWKPCVIVVWKHGN